MNVTIQTCIGDLTIGVLRDAGLGDGGGLRNWGVDSFVGVWSLSMLIKFPTFAWKDGLY